MAHLSFGGDIDVLGYLGRRMRIRWIVIGLFSRCICSRSLIFWVRFLAMRRAIAANISIVTFDHKTKK
jgi:hypothetical protein